jgi:hypothetical protein
MSDIPFRLGQLEDEVPQPQGNIIHAAHTEPPRLHFVVGFDAAPYRNVLRFAATQRRIFVLAETEEGAIRVARYRYGRRVELQGRRPHIVVPSAGPRGPGHSHVPATAALKGAALAVIASVPLAISTDGLCREKRTPCEVTPTLSRVPPA